MLDTTRHGTDDTCSDDDIHPRTEGTSGQPKEYDDLVTIELACQLKCLLLDNDNYRQYLELGGENRLASESESKRNH